MARITGIAILRTLRVLLRILRRRDCCERRILPDLSLLPSSLRPAVCLLPAAAPDALFRLGDEVSRLADGFSCLAGDVFRLAEEPSRLAEEPSCFADDVFRLGDDSSRLAEDDFGLAGAPDFSPALFRREALLWPAEAFRSLLSKPAVLFFKADFSPEDGIPSFSFPPSLRIDSSETEFPCESWYFFCSSSMTDYLLLITI